MQTTLRAATLAALLATPAAAQTHTAQAPAQPNWAGTYRYDWSGGRTAGGSPMEVTYTLRLGNTPADCALDVTGYQSDEHILCEAAADATTLWIRFRSYADGKRVNQYGTAVYTPGRDLFRLRRKDAHTFLTDWESMTPETRKTAPAPRFRKL